MFLVLSSALTGLSDVWPNIYGGGHTFGNFSIGFNSSGLTPSPTYSIGSVSLGETIYFYPGIYTRRYGIVEIPAFETPTMTFHGTQQLPASDVSPAQNVSGDLMVKLLAPAISLPFDTGNLPFTSYDGQYFRYEASPIALHLPMSGVFELTSGGFTITETINFSVRLELHASGHMNRLYEYMTTPPYDVLYPIGFEASPIIFGNTTTHVYSQTMPNGFNATMSISVPEPTTNTIISVAILALIKNLRKSKSRKPCKGSRVSPE